MRTGVPQVISYGLVELEYRSPIAPESKNVLFRSLFRGRDDVYARRFDSRKTGKSGYSPAYGNGWMPGVCEKRRINCAASSVSGKYSNEPRFLNVIAE